MIEEVAVKLEERAKALKMSLALKPQVALVIAAKAIAEVERERVDAIQRKELAEQMYYGRLRDGRQVRILDPKLSYLMDEESGPRYFDKLNAIHLANGFADAAKGFCPALVAEVHQTESENALIKAAEEFFPGVTNEKLLCGVKGKGGLETRQEYLDLIIKLVVNAPGNKRKKGA